MIVQYELDPNQKATPEQIRELEEAKKAPIVYDDDCPELTEEELKQFRRVNSNKRITLSISKESYEALQSLGGDYTSTLSRIVEEIIKGLLPTNKKVG